VYENEEMINALKLFDRSW